MAHIAAGDQHAFAWLYDRIAAPLYTAALQHTAHPEHAEKLTQHSLLELWRTAAHYDPHQGSALSRALDICHRAQRARPDSAPDTYDWRRVPASLPERVQPAWELPATVYWRVTAPSKSQQN